SCTPGTAAADDATCDGVDDDCDDATDEDYQALQTSCGIGACAATGVTSCIGGTEQDSCSPGTAAADDATCDGVDDDCDGSADEDSVCPAGGICQEGQCIGGDQVTSGCGCSSTNHQGPWTCLLLFGLLIWFRRGAARSRARSRL
ncbi:MAG: MopE-related protein, partial [Verrucomicrobiota bacterium]|nr:MopE-related protein [Verrucomicrobiota bacterium]